MILAEAARTPSAWLIGAAKVAAQPNKLKRRGMTITIIYEENDVKAIVSRPFYPGEPTEVIFAGKPSDKFPSDEIPF